MQLYLLRHADADTVAPSDDQRFLSEKGVMQASRVARYCDAHDIRPRYILTSPLRRAHQTANEIAGHLNTELIAVRWLICGATPAGILERLDEYKSASSVMLVGHEPDLSSFAGYLLGSSYYGCIHVRKATMLCIELPELLAGFGRLEFSIPARLM